MKPLSFTSKFYEKGESKEVGAFPLFCLFKMKHLFTFLIVLFVGLMLFGVSSTLTNDFSTYELSTLAKNANGVVERVKGWFQ